LLMFDKLRLLVTFSLHVFLTSDDNKLNGNKFVVSLV